MRAGNLLTIFCLILPAVAAVADSQPQNTIVIANDSAAELSSRTISVSRAFTRGEIRRCAAASDKGTILESQCDAKNRWPDGSLKFAIVTFVAPLIAPKHVLEIKFVDDDHAVEKRSVEADVKKMLDPALDFDAGIEVQGDTRSRISARTLIDRGSYRIWLQGPLVTGIVVEDNSPARASDVGIDGDHPLHAVFEIWLYPREKRFEVGYSLENTWASSLAEQSARPVSYAFALDLGLKDRKTVYRNPKFLHLPFTRWHRTVSTPAFSEPNVDHNAAYLVSTGVLPHWNAAVKISPLLISRTYGRWKDTNHDIGGKGGQLGNYNVAMNAGGAADWIGLATTWDIIYLLTSSRQLKEVTYGNADLGGGIPWHFREADERAGTGHFFDSPLNGSVSSFGRIVSINARRQVTLGDLADQCSGGSVGDMIRLKENPNSGWPVDLSHMPDLAYLPYLLSGRYYYLSELQFQAGFILGAKLGCVGGEFARQGSMGFLDETQVRGEAWGIRTLAYASFISPDGSAEKAYFEDKLMNNLAELEGIHVLPLTDQRRAAAYAWGRNKYVASQDRYPSPLHFWQDRGPEFIQPPLKEDGSLSGAASPWEENFLTCAFGLTRQFGYPADALLKFMAYRPFNTLLNPRVGHPELIEAYRYPTKDKQGRWISRWEDLPTYYAKLPEGWQKNGSIDHSYGFIAMSAISFLYDFTVDGISGKAVWQYMLNNKPEQERLGTESPKWSLTPLAR